MISQSFQAQATISAEQFGRIACGEYAMPSNVQILSSRPDGSGNVIVVFAGAGLGLWAVPVPPQCEVGLSLDETTLLIQPIGGSSSSSGIP